MAGYDGYGIPRLDFSPLARIPAQMRESQAFDTQQRIQANRERTLAELGQGVPIGDVSRKLFAAGDVEGGLSLARLADAQAMREYNIKRDERDFGFRQQEAQRAERQADRNYGLQVETLREKPQIKTVKDAAGNESLKLVTPQGKVTDLDTGPAGPTNPFAPEGKMTESQAKDALYARRMLASEKVLRDVENVGTSALERGRGYVSDKIGYNIRGGEYQKFDQAQRDFINATLRRESGAVISPAEFDNANKQYFPQPGDTPEVIRQKRANRREAIQGIGAGAGPAWRPDYTFGPNGELNRTGPAAAPAPPPTSRVRGAFDAATARPEAQAAPVQYDRPEISQARAAIAQGADPQKVRDRLKRMGVQFDPRDLELN